ncbi:MAG: class I SAM-dependent methyltransferase [Spirochaetales bacterium]|nr:class I SAM-dependent methyltransferase [Spirochaetales bacterium]
MPENDLPRYIGPETRNRNHKMTSEEIKRRFDNETAACYSRRRPAWFMEADEIFAAVPELLAPYLPSGSEFLDLGAGTGNFSRSVMERLPGLRAVLLDFSPNMLSGADEALKGFAGRFRKVEGDFASADLGVGLYSAVISSFAIHHLRSEADYLSLYRRIRAALKPPGAFVCCDVVAGGDDFLTRRNEDEWAAYLKRQGFSDDDVSRLLSNHHREDSPLALGAHLRLLGEAGFSTVDVVWKKANFAVYIGVVGEGRTMDGNGWVRRT